MIPRPSYRAEQHNFLTGIPFEPPRSMPPRVWLAWLLHSTWTPFTLYVGLLPAYMWVFARDAVLRSFRDSFSFSQGIVFLLYLAPVVTAAFALFEAVTFASLVSRGLCVITRVRGVHAEKAPYWPRSYTVRTDVRFEYQGAREGVNIQGGWDGRIRFLREPIEGQTMPVLFDPADPRRRLLLWQFGLTTGRD